MSLLLFLRCNGCNDNPGGDCTGLGGPGDPCTSNDQCCGPAMCDTAVGQCIASSCGVAGQPCPSGLDATCCSGLCDQATLTCSQSCGGFGATCSTGETCCSGVCDITNMQCTQPPSCIGAGSACKSGAECCGRSCVNGVCGASCVSSGQACTVSGECCSGNCGAGGTCVSANGGACGTGGEACTNGSSCCSKLCNGTPLKCSTFSSYCLQNQDTCVTDAQCCSQNCVIANGMTVGTCQENDTSGAGGCTVQGTVCNGGCECCSALCLGYNGGATKVCQVAQGCHVTGELCTKTTDCCGAPGTMLPGEGSVYCNIAPGNKVGVCHKPSGCQVQGGLCKYNGTLPLVSCTSFRNACCNPYGLSNKDYCQPDKSGIPRCQALGANMCRMAGQTCSNTLDCCPNAAGGPVACVPDPMGILRCNTCSPADGPCTTAADCCTVGYQCIIAQGSVQGRCRPPNVPDGGTAPDGGLCPQYGQDCTVGGTACCDNVPCTSKNLATYGKQCAAGESGCACVVIIP